MYGLDSDQSLDFLEQAVLLQICVGENELLFRFEGEITLAVESDLRIRQPQLDQLFSSSVEAARIAVDFLGRAVTTVRVAAEGTLVVDFGLGMSLEILDSSSAYESYTLTWPGGEIVV